MLLGSISKSAAPVSLKVLGWNGKMPENLNFFKLFFRNCISCALNWHDLLCIFLMKTFVTVLISGCKIPVDLGIVFEPYKTVLGNITRVVRNMSVSKESTHIALRTIERESELLLKFDGRQTPKKVERIIESITPKQPSGKIIRPLISALELAKDMFNETNGGRPEAIKVLL